MNCEGFILPPTRGGQAPVTEMATFSKFAKKLQTLQARSHIAVPATCHPMTPWRLRPLLHQAVCQNQTRLSGSKVNT